MPTFSSNFFFFFKSPMQYSVQGFQAIQEHTVHKPIPFCLGQCPHYHEIPQDLLSISSSL